MKKLQVGLLPLYIKLYDDVLPERHADRQAFACSMADQLETRDLNVHTTPVCRLESEFAAAVSACENAGCVAIITLHLAYSPSLESAAILARSRIPVIVLDTTPDADFPFDYGDRLMANHGIHGVQDLCNLLVRLRKPFLIHAGHWQTSDVLDRVADSVRAAAMTATMTGARVGCVGGSFKGMGDFVVPDGTFGLKFVHYTDRYAVKDDTIDAEIATLQNRFVHGRYSQEALRATVTAGLKIRQWLEAEKLDAFTLCFMGITRQDGWPTVPFLEASLAMSRGIGYAGEGDPLDAAFAAALLRVFPQTGFSEMFCPDWTGNRIFLSHMGEMNPDLAQSPPLLSERDYIFSDTGNPVLATACFRPGPALLANLAPGPDATFSLIVKTIELSTPDAPSTAANTGWFTPTGMRVADFLEAYSLAGGTHHLMISYDARPDLLAQFARLMGWNFRNLG